jgi:hypothetical protein
MKKLSSIATIMSIGLALAAGACGKDKKPAATDPAAAAPADPAAKPADPNAKPADPAAADPNAAKPEEKKAGGW